MVGRDVRTPGLDFDGGRLNGWLLRPADRPAHGTVIVMAGQSGWGLAYLPMAQAQAQALARRGVATLLAEGPGQGLTRLQHGVMLDADVTAAYRRFVDHIMESPSLGAPGICGNSLGGLWAATTAAADSRIAACCVNGALAMPRLLPLRTFKEHAAAMLGITDPDRIERNFARLAFDPAAQRIGCPLLVLHGGEDPIIDAADQQPFLDGADSPDVTLRVWPDGDHTIYNHYAERTALVADWFADRLRT